MKRKLRSRQGVPVLLPKGLNQRFIDDLLSSIPESPRGTYLRSMVLSKYNGTSDDPDLRRNRAISKWLETERRNLRTNMRLLTDSTTFCFRKEGKVHRVHSDRIIGIARAFADDILGSHKWRPGSFSGGASTSRTRLESHPAEKFTGKADITAEARSPWAHECFQFPRLSSIDIRVVEGNILFTVPKSAEIDRVACKEPDLNMYLQKAVGDQIRHRLRKAGVDLNDQSINQRLAREGSITGRLATIDLSSASDSVTTQLACRILPADLFDILMRLRSPSTLVDGVPHENQMLSSMGNGFTFEVESLIFYVIARAVAYIMGASGRISVYGDDIICPSHTVPLLTNVLGFCGFIVNQQKSFHTGPFRESCGAHWLNGRCVKPFYVRRPVTALPDLILHLNAVRRWWSLDEEWVDSDIYPFWAKYAVLVPPQLWGGRDLSSNETLVSRRGRARRLIPVELTKRNPPDGGVLAWLRATLEREDVGDPVELSTKRVPTGRYVIRPSWAERLGDILPAKHCFVEEYTELR